MTVLERIITRELLIAPRIGAQVAFSLGCLYVAWRFLPPRGAEWIDYAVPGLAGFVGLRLAWNAFLGIVDYHLQLGRRRQARKGPDAAPGDARLGTEADLERWGQFDPNDGVPVGMVNGRPVFSAFTHAWCVAPSGSGKTTSVAIPALVHGYRIPGKRKKGTSRVASTVVMDLKDELYAMTHRVRAELHGHRIVKLSPSDSRTDCYNLLDPAIDAVAGRWPREKAMMVIEAIVLMLEPEPTEDAKNRFWREGGREIVVIVILWLCIFHPERATMPEVSRIVREPNALSDVLIECAGISESPDGVADPLVRELGTMARDKVAQERHFDEFRTGAALALRPFSPAGALARVSGRSTFRWHDTKRQPVTIYVRCNLTEARVLKRWLGAIAEIMCMELEFSPGNIPVHILLDEGTNLAGFNIAEKLTALRAVGCRVQIIIQERSEGERAWGKHAMETIQGEVNAEQYLAPIRDPKLAEELERRMGTVLRPRASYQAGQSFHDAIGRSDSFERVPLLSKTHMLYGMNPGDQLLFLAGKVQISPILCQKLSYDAVAEWLDWLDDNPVEGGKLPGPSTISIRYTKNGARVRRCRRAGMPGWRIALRLLRRLLPPLWAGWAVGWSVAAYFFWVEALRPLIAL